VPKPHDTRFEKSYWAYSNYGYRWKWLPDSLEEVFQAELSPNEWKNRPKQVALGMDDAWVVVYDSGTIWSRSITAYKKLWKILSKARTEVNVSHICFSHDP
jgi:hypothetical protein